MSEWEAYREHSDELIEDLNRATEWVAHLRRRAFGSGATEEDRRLLEEAERLAAAILEAMGELESEMMSRAGITEEQIEQIEEERDQRWLDPVDRSGRRAVSAEHVEPTDQIEAILPRALESLLAGVDPAWLREQGELGFRLGREILTEPLSIIRGVRIASETRPIHRFAQMLLVSADFLKERADYDRFAGALLVPQAAALGDRMADLANVRGEVEQRITALWRHASRETDSTIYELLVAGTFARSGLPVEFLTAGRSGTGVKVPDLRLHRYSFPFVVECKRRQAVTDADLEEETQVQALFAVLRAACVRRGMWGRFEVRFQVEPAEIPASAVTEAALQQRLAAYPHQYTEYPWGRIAYHALPSVVDMLPTPLYSPLFLRRVFNWNTDLPTHDGLVCQVDDPGDLVVDRVHGAVGLAWTNDSPRIFRKRARAFADLFNTAMKQIPPGEMGAIYICYQEGDREEVADDRIRFLQKEMSDWEHSSKIRVPLTVLTRLVARPLEHGMPDMIETAILPVAPCG